VSPDALADLFWLVAGSRVPPAPVDYPIGLLFLDEEAEVQAGVQELLPLNFPFEVPVMRESQVPSSGRSPVAEADFARAVVTLCYLDHPQPPA